MKGEIDDGGPAFPLPAGGVMQDGMTLRDWFAGQALNGMLSYSMNDACGNWNNNASKGVAARVAYEYADAMLGERRVAR